MALDAILLPARARPALAMLGGVPSYRGLGKPRKDEPVRRALYIFFILLSTAVVLYLCLGLHLLRFQNIFTSSIVVLAPLIFAMPWIVMLKEKK